MPVCVGGAGIAYNCVVRTEGIVVSILRNEQGFVTDWRVSSSRGHTHRWGGEV